LALLPCCEPAIRGATATEPAHIIVGAPLKTVIRLSGLFDADDAGENYQDEQ
jgi:hypothetical protein